VFGPRIAGDNEVGLVEGEGSLAPQASFAGHALETPWTEPQLAYFAGYAMWTYLNLPRIARGERKSRRRCDPMPPQLVPRPSCNGDAQCLGVSAERKPRRRKGLL
jgi:hypothetical protein